MSDKEKGLRCQSTVVLHMQDPTLPTWRQDEHFI